MAHTTYITSSWDDGHPLDLRVAEILTKYGLDGTFYVPQSAENETMSPAQVRDLSSAFEIGAHTLHHTVITSSTHQQSWLEIADSKSWVEDTTGRPCLMFCPPLGKYSHRHILMVRKAGYLGLRSVELASLGFPRVKSGLAVMPTTVQAHPHSRSVYARNACKRAAFGNLWRLVIHARSTNWPALAHAFLHDALNEGGVFHLWGHSWELEESGQWHRLEGVLRLMSEMRPEAPSLTNGRLCELFHSPILPADEPARESATGATPASPLAGPGTGPSRHGAREGLQL